MTENQDVRQRKKRRNKEATAKVILGANLARKEHLRVHLFLLRMMYSNTPLSIALHPNLKDMQEHITSD